MLLARLCNGFPLQFSEVRVVLDEHPPLLPSEVYGLVHIERPNDLGVSFLYKQ